MSDNEDSDFTSSSVTKDNASDEVSEYSRREPSPELARISALITRPPKQKQSAHSKCLIYCVSLNYM